VQCRATPVLLREKILLLVLLPSSGQPNQWHLSMYHRPPQTSRTLNYIASFHSDRSPKNTNKITRMLIINQRCPSRLKTDRCRAAMREAKYLPRRCRTAPKITSTAAAPHRDGYFRKSTATAPLPRWASEKSFNSHDCDCFGLELWSPLNHISRISLCCI
jgi:hypothetical protein